jgi:hypothetical protein
VEDLVDAVTPRASARTTFRFGLGSLVSLLLGFGGCGIGFDVGIGNCRLIAGEGCVNRLGFRRGINMVLLWGVMRDRLSFRRDVLVVLLRLLSRLVRMFDGGSVFGDYLCR